MCYDRKRVGTPAKYDGVENYSGRWARVRIGDYETGKEGYVDEQGNESWD